MTMGLLLTNGFSNTLLIESGEMLVFKNLLRQQFLEWNFYKKKTNLLIDTIFTGIDTYLWFIY